MIDFVVRRFKLGSLPKTELELHDFENENLHQGESLEKRFESSQVAKGSLAQLVQSTCLTSKGSCVRTAEEPQKYYLGDT